jgi:hypothetical protein
MRQTLRARFCRLATAFVLLWALALAPVVSHAGRPCEARPPSAESLQRGLQLAAETRDALIAAKAEVAVIARAGQDLRKYNLTYSHAAFVVRDHPDGDWTVIHLLNHCGTPESGLFTEGLGMFYMDDPFRYEALLMIPSAELQTKLKALLASDMPRQFKAARYNMLAYPFNDASQNSNQWVLEMLAVALSSADIRSRANAHLYLKRTGYEPSTIHLDALTRLGAAATRQNINFDDHPFGKRMAGRIETATVESLLRFLLQRDQRLRLREIQR